MDGYGISRDYLNNTRVGINAGYIIIPSGVGRDDYVLNSYRRERVSIQLENGGGVVHDCYITISALREIKFPEEVDQLGSAVTFVSDPYMDRPIILGVLSKQDENTGLGEEEIRIIKTKDNNYVAISVDGKTGELSIDLIGNNQGGRATINIRNGLGTAQLNVNVKGNINIYASGDVSINPEGVFNISGADEPITKANTLKEELDKNTARIDDIISTLKTNIVTVATHAASSLAGGQAILADLALIINKEDYSDIGSEKSFTE